MPYSIRFHCHNCRNPLTIPDTAGHHPNQPVRVNCSHCHKANAVDFLNRNTPMSSTLFTYIWRNKFLTIDATSLPDMIARLRDATALLEEMEAAGVTLADSDGTADDHATLTTEDPTVADRFGFQADDEDDMDDDGVPTTDFE